MASKLCRFQGHKQLLFSLINCFFIAFCVNEWMLYIGAAISILDATSTTLFRQVSIILSSPNVVYFSRSLITKNVNPDEVGKIFSIVGTFQALVPFASSPVFGFLYRETVSYLPAAFLFLVAGLKLIEAIVVLLVYVGVKQDDRKRQAEMKEKQQELKQTLLTESHKVA